MISDRRLVYWVAEGFEVILGFEEDRDSVL